MGNLHRATSSSDEGAHIGDGICTHCYGMGRSRIEKRDVPGFREIIVRAFECEDCRRTTDEVQLAGQYDPQGVRLSLQVPQGCAATLGRQCLKSDTATISVPELEFEIGAGSYVPFAGDLTTVADVLMQACRNLNMNQAERRAGDPETASKIDAFISELEEYATGGHAFTFVLEDSAGNSFIGGPDNGPANAASGDPQLQVERFTRTAVQESRMGLAMPDEFLQEGEQEEQQGAGQQQEAAPEPASAPGRLILRVEGGEEVAAFLASYAASETVQQQQEQQHTAEAAGAPAADLQLPSSCAACGTATGSGFSAALHRTVPAFIPDCLIVSSSCAGCGASVAEVRGTGGVSRQGARLRLRVDCAADMQRAVLQSASASIAVPELELALSSGSSGGMSTTVGQLISNLAEQLGSNPALAPGGAAVAALSDGGDGVKAEQAEWREFVAALRSFAALEQPWTLEVTDPLDSSWVAPAEGKSEQDDRLAVVRYERSAEEDAHFGLSQGGGAAQIA